MADEVLSTLIQPSSHENNRPIRPGMEDDRTLASMGVLDAAKHINSAEKFKVTARLGHVVIAILNRSRFWAHGHGDFSILLRHLCQREMLLRDKHLRVLLLRDILLRAILL
jgi:hypothetical protein